ncbi:GntP family permease [Clostridiales bacterium FE2011]|nr:GntP family permease [Clostridiales bacterium FE2011]QTE74461.1 GntP family permease [Clostridiales bacterium FE2010]
MTGLPLIIVFIVAIVLMILLISKLKVHPFLAIMGISLLLAIVAGIPLNDVKNADGIVEKIGIPNVIGEGFASTFKSIGIVIILGAFIGSVLEKTGAALKLADMVIKLVGEKHPQLAIELMGWVVSIPVFCDSGFVILNPIRKALVKRTGVSSVAMTVCLSCGLYISHVFIPPTPGPIAAAQTLGVGESLLLVIGIGILCSICPLIAGYFYAKFIGKKIKSADETGDSSEVVKSYEELKAEFGKLPGGINALAPLLVPILLMALSSISSMAGWTGPIAGLLTFLGTPVMALAVGTVLAVIQIFTAGKGKDFYNITNETLKTVGPILFVTAAGGVLGKVISSSDMVNFIKANATTFQTIGIFFPFLLSAILKSAQGSSTVAITTTAGIVAPLLPVLGFATPVEIALVVMAIGAGAMTVSHANDSYFWVVTNFGEMQPEEGYKTQTAMTLVIGIAAIIEIFILSLIF